MFGRLKAWHSRRPAFRGGRPPQRGRDGARFARFGDVVFNHFSPGWEPGNQGATPLGNRGV